MLDEHYQPWDESLMAISGKELTACQGSHLGFHSLLPLGAGVWAGMGMSGN